ncbi:ABC transporter ATP-binding protein [Lactobacillaceae bacterium L1_55_11]|nr:ABC transporter ATP-binding protein [Lactobacillaceae bacterium L1_55_11]
MVTIAARDLGIRYGKTSILSDVNFQIHSEAFVVILGDNGAGKTSLIRTILGQTQPSTGTLTVQAQKIGYVPQFRSISADYPLSVRDFVGLGFNQPGRLWFNAQEKAAIQAAIKQVDLTDLANHRLGLSSGGQKQRAFVAQALAQEPDLLILDEPTASLDEKHSLALVKMVRRLQQERGLTVLWITHDTQWINDYADDYLWLANGDLKQGKIADLAQDVPVGHRQEVNHV